MSTSVADLLRANCKTIWGSECDYFLDQETDGRQYLISVQKDVGTSLKLVWVSNPYPDQDVAWRRFTSIVERWAADIKRDKAAKEKETTSGASHGAGI